MIAVTNVAKAHELRKVGRFLVDIERGLVIGRSGVPIGHLERCGYTRVSIRGHTHQLAHRLVWESVHGPIPDGLQINHINGIKTDNRIANLELVTPAENMAHALRTGLRVPTRGENNGGAKLRNADIADIRSRLLCGQKQSEIARIFGVDQSMVSRIKSGKKWGSV